MTYLKTKDKTYNYNKIYYVNYDNFIYRLLVSKKTLQGYMFYCDGTFYALCEINFNEMNVTYKDTVMDILESEVSTAGAFRFLGSVDSFNDLPKDANNGDVYQVGDKEYVWDGKDWVLLGFNMDLSDYATLQYVKDQNDVLSSNINANKSSIDKEISDREAADKVITDNLTTESSERKASDKTLEDKINNVSTFNITLTENENNKTYIADKTYEEIKAAYDSNRPIIVTLGEAWLPLMNVEINSNDAGFSFGYTQVQYGGEYVYTRIIHYLHTSTEPISDVWSDNDRFGYYIQLEQVKNALGEIIGYEVSSNINMGENAIENIQKLHIDGQAPLYIGQVVETQDINRPRLTGVVNSNAAAFVKSGSQTEYVPLFVATPSDNNHAATKKYVDDNKGTDLSSGGTISGNLSVTGNLSITGTASSIKEPTEGVDLCNKTYTDGKINKLFSYDSTTKTLSITTV